MCGSVGEKTSLVESTMHGAADCRYIKSITQSAGHVSQKLLYKSNDILWFAQNLCLLFDFFFTVIARNVIVHI